MRLLKVAIQFLRYATGGVNQTFLLLDESLWFVNDGKMPPDEPLCGFRNDQCNEGGTLPRSILSVIIAVPLVVISGMAVAAAFAITRLRFASMSWQNFNRKTLPTEIEKLSNTASQVITSGL